MRMSPEDPGLRRALRELAKTNIRSAGEEKILYLDFDYQVVEAVYHSEIEAGGHRRVRDQLLGQAKLRAILHLGLVHADEPQCYIHVVDPDAHDKPARERLMTLRQYAEDVRWVPTTAGAQAAWLRRWSD